VGWVSVPHETLRGLRAVVAAQGPASGFLLMADVNGKMDGLAVHKPQLFEKLSMDLANLEALVLLLRCAFGWNASVDELLGLSRPAIEQRVYELLGPTDLMLFFALLRGR
jgi:hypothetical protein